MAGALSLEEDAVWNMSPRVLVWMYRGKSQLYETQMQAIWEAARLTSVSVMNSQGAKIKKLDKFMSFPWEQSQSKGLSKETIKRLRNKYEKHGIK